VIGRPGGCPAHSCRSSVFKRLTVGKPIVMGRKTFDSIGSLATADEHRRDRRAGWRAEGVVVATDLPTAFALGFEDALRNGAEEVMVIGGSTLYSQSLSQAARIISRSSPRL